MNALSRILEALTFTPPPRPFHHLPAGERAELLTMARELAELAARLRKTVDDPTIGSEIIRHRSRDIETRANQIAARL